MFKKNLKCISIILICLITITAIWCSVSYIDVSAAPSQIVTKTKKVNGNTLTWKYTIVFEDSYGSDVTKIGSISDSSFKSNWSSYSTIYDGTAKTPRCTLLAYNPNTSKWNRVPAKNRTKKYSNNTKASNDATITFVVDSDYTGTGDSHTCVFKFKIKQATNKNNFKFDSFKKTDGTVIPTDRLNNSSNPYWIYYGGYNGTFGVIKSSAGKVVTSDFTPTWKNHVNAGTATVTYTGKGTNVATSVILTQNYIIGQNNFNYNTAKFFINDNQYNVSTNAGLDYVYTGNPVVTKDDVAIQQNLYSIEDGQKKDVDIADSDYSLSFSNITNVGTGYITFTPKGNFKGSSLKIPVNIRQANFANISDDNELEVIYNESQYWTGSAIQPDVLLIYNNIPLTLGKDYTIQYSNNIEPGEGTIIINGINSFAGTIEESFTINETYNSEGLIIENVENQTYTGAEITPNINVYDAQGNSLDYTVEYDNNIDVGTAIATIKVNGCANEFVRKFSIIPKSINDLTVNGILDCSYTGLEITQPDILMYFNGTSLSEYEDFTVTYTDNVDVGVATVYINGVGNYSGSIEKTFKILSTDINECSISDISDKTYTGTNIEPLITIKLDTVTLVQGVDYDVMYENNIDVGTAKVIVNGKGNFSGETFTEFEIIQKTIFSGVNLVYEPETTYSSNEEDNKISVSVMYNGAELNEYIDYEIDYENYENAGTAKFTINLIGNYSGTITKTYKINKFDINNIDKIKAFVSLENQGSHSLGSFKYTGDPIVIDLEIDELNEGDDYTIAYVDNINVGVATATLVGKGNYSGTINLTFEIGKESINSYIPTDIEDCYEYTGSEIKPVTSLDDLIYGTDYTITYNNNINVGIATIIFEGKGNYSGISYRYFNIVPIDIEDCEVNIFDDNLIFTGENIEPKVTVKYNSYLVRGVDYKITYSNNIDATDNAIIEIEGIGNYTGIANEIFSIEPKDISNTVVVSEIPDYYYTGKVITPSLNIFDGEIQLIQGKDFNVNYNNNIDVESSASIDIEFIGNYSGDKTVSFSILAVNIKDFNPLISVNAVTYTGDEVEPEIYVEGLVLDEDYSITYSNNINVGTATITITGIENYTGKMTVNFEICPANISNFKIGRIDTETYTGEEIAPEIIIGDLEEDIDFTVTYYNNINVGTATAILTGKGNYIGTATTSFRITGLDIEDTEILDVSEQTFTGKEIKPKVEICNGYTDLIENVDYVLYYKNNIKANNNSYIIVKGIGNYTGSTNVSFEINPKIIKKSDISVSYTTSEKYTGQEICPAVTVKLNTNGKMLEETEDYEINYEDNIDAGTGRVIISFINNYESDDMEFKFVISKQSLELATVSPIENQKFTGDEIEPDIYIVCNGEIISDDNYTLRYSNNVNIGKATITIVGQENFTGTKIVTFNITGAPVNTVSFNSIDSEEYTGRAIRPDVGADGLTQNIDYTVTYYNNINVGTAKVLVKGKGNYSGTTELYFNITKKSISSAEVSGIHNKTYTSNAVTQSVSVYDDNEKLIKNTDYTVGYLNNINPGTAKIIIKGKGNYSGTITNTFIIKPSKVTNVSVSKKSSMYVTLKWNIDSKVKGYKIYNQNNKLLKTINYNKTNSCVLKIKTGVPSYFKVRSYIVGDGKKYNGEFSDLVVINIKIPTPKNLTLKTSSKSITATSTKVGDATGYQYAISTSKNGKYKTVYTGKNKTKKISNLKKGVKYYVKVRAYKTSYGTRFYSNYTKPKSIKCK